MEIVKTIASPRRMELGRRLLWGSLIAGVATNLFEVFWMAFAFFEPVLFIIGLILARGSNPMAIKAGAVGVALSIVAVPLWFHIACAIADAHFFG